MPKVSVILTSFNHEKYIRESIDSVLNQSFTNFELIIWDDASADGSWAVINSYSDSRIKTFRNEVTRRGIYGINKAISEVASGEYIAIHHSDDVWELDKLEKQVAYLDTNPEFGAVFTNALAIGEDGSPLKDPSHFYFNIFNQPNRTRHQWLNHFFYECNALCHPSVLIRKQCYADCGLYRYGLGQLGDFDMWIRLCLKYEIHAFPERLVRFRVRDNEANTSGSSPENHIRHITEFYNILKNFLKVETFEEMVGIFPEVREYYREAGFEPHFVLAMAALGDKSKHFAKAFALGLLFDLLNIQSKAKNIKFLYDFDYINFIALTAKYDTFSYQAMVERDGQIASVNQAMAERDGRIANLNQAMVERDGQIVRFNTEITRIKRSLSWQITKPLRLFATISRSISKFLNPQLMTYSNFSKIIDLIEQIYSYSRRHGIRQTAIRIVSRLASDLRGYLTLQFLLKQLPWETSNAVKWFDDIQPDVSIIVLNYNQSRMTLECLGSIWKHTVGHKYEIIIVDNGSNLSNSKLLQQIPGRAKVVFLNINRYFGEGNNIGAEFSKAPYLVFMNNDIVVHEGWLAPLITRLSATAGVGGVGPRFIYPDGRLQEAGAFIMADGTAVQRGKFGNPWDAEFSIPGPVDYVSAATFAVRRCTFEKVLGFDLAFEPAYYEDTDLCMKIRALGLQIWYEPGATVTHIESVTSSDPRHGLKLNNIVEINRRKFCAKWEKHLAQNSIFSVIQSDEKFLKRPTVRLGDRIELPTLALYTPYPLTPGGGERYLLTIAEAMAEDYVVYLITPERWSRLRILTLGQELGLELAHLQLFPIYEMTDQVFDVCVVMGNSILPPIASLGKTNIYHCQFPFPTIANSLLTKNSFWKGYTRLVVNSEFTRNNCLLEVRRHRLETRPIEIISPPVPMHGRTFGDLNRKLAIVNIGRFFPGGHCKRQDALISVFRKIVLESGFEAELHLIGSLYPEAEHRDYLLSCMKLAEGLPVFFHLNASLEKLKNTLQKSLIYWHGTGYGVDSQRDPSKCEHFGISVIEAMSAGCIPMAVRSGGPCETIEDGVSGFLWSDLGELRNNTEKILMSSGEPWVKLMSENAVMQAQQFSEDAFRIKWNCLIKDAVSQENIPS